MPTNRARIRAPLASSLLALACAAACFGQPSNIIVGAGYSVPAPIQVAPGQIVTLYALGIGRGLTQELWASGLPLPVSLGGISVTLQQSSGTQAVQVPLISVKPQLETLCVGGSAQSCPVLTAITVQIPFELIPNNPLSLGPLQHLAVLVLNENGVPGGAVGIFPRTDMIHIPTSCDGLIPPPTNTVCAGAVTHVDGKRVTASNPANVGETVVIYATGLGLTLPPVASGQPSPNPPPIPPQIWLSFDYGTNLAPRGPSGGGSEFAPGTTFVGLSPGSVGLYQVNFTVPSPPLGTPRCGGTVDSNLTVRIAGVTSFDGAGLCVSVQ